MNIQDRRKTLTVEELRRRYNLDALDKDRKAIKLQKEQLTKVDAELNDFVEITTKNLKELQDQVDGNITTWFFNGVPTVENEPASNWTTDTDKNNHLGDLYYDQDTGYAYRWAYENNTYVWSKIIDTDVVEALAVANAAQDTADSKRRVFVVQPKPPYDIGDIWIKEDTDLYRCRASRSEGNFNTADWIRATNYTDDTVALGTKAELDQFKTTVTENYVTNATLETTTSSIEAKVTEVYEYTTAVENEVNGLTENVSNTIENVSKLTTDVNGISGRVSSTETQIEDITTTTQTSTGPNELYITDALESNALEYHIEGKSEQETRSGKNKFNPDILTEETVNGITLTKNKNGTITLNGTATADAIFDFSGFSITGTGNETMSLHRISGTGTDGRKLVEFALYEDDNFTNMISATVSATGHQFTKTLVDGVTYKFGDIYIKEGLTCDNFVVGIQIEDKELTDFEQYGAMPSPDYPSEIKTIPSVINLFENKLENGSLNGIDYIVNKDKSITLNGIASIDTIININSIPLNSGIYTMNGCPIGGTLQSYRLFIRGTNIVDYGSGTKLALTEKTTYTIAIGIASGTTVDNLTFKPMINEGLINHNYVPYGSWAKVKIINYKNIFDINKIVKGYGLNSNDTGVYPNSERSYLNYTEIEPNTYYSLSNITPRATQFFDEDKKFISGLNNVTEFTTPSKARYVRIAFLNTDSYINAIITNKKYDDCKEKEVLIDLSKPNLFDGLLSVGTIDGTNGSDASSTIRVRSINPIPVKPNTTYTLNSDTSGSKGFIFEYKNDGTFIQRIASSFTTLPFTFKTSSNTYFIRFMISKSDESTITINDIDNITVHEGYTDHYELSSNNTLEAVRGLFTKNTYIHTITGDETVAVINSGTDNWYYRITPTIVKTISSQTNQLSNYYPNMEIFNGNTNQGIMMTNNGLEIRIRYGTEDTANNFKSLLKEKHDVGNPLTLQVELSEPETVQLKPTSIPLFDGFNHLTLVDDIETTTSIKYLRKTPISGEYATNQQLKTTEANLNSQINQTATSITSEVSAKYSTKIETENAKTEAINSANDSTDTKLENYSTTVEMNNAITQKVSESESSITSSISSTYSTKEETETAKEEAISSSNTSMDTKLANYSTTTEMNNAITQKVTDVTNEINLEVSKKVNNDDYTSANIIAKINNDTSEAVINADKVSLEGKEINLTSGNITINSNNFSVDKEGNVTCNNANIKNAIFNANNADITKASIILSTGSAYNGELKTEIFPSIIELTNQATDIGGMVEPQLRLSSTLTGGSTTIGADELYTGTINATGNITTSSYLVAGGNRAVTSPYVHWLNIGTSGSTKYLELNLYNSYGGYSQYGINMWVSDKRLKDNIEDTEYNALEKLKLIKHRQFDYKEGGHVNLGYVADELEEVDSDLIFEVGEEKLKQPSIEKLIPLLSKAIQEQQEKIEKLEERLKELEEKWKI